MCVDSCHSRGVRGFPGREEHVLKCRRFAAPVRGPAPGSWGHHVPRRTRGMGARGMGGGTDLPPLGGKSSVQDRVRPWSPTHNTQRGGPDPASPDSAGREAHVEAPSPAAPDTPASSSVRALHWGERHGWPRPGARACRDRACLCTGGRPPISRSGAHRNSGGLSRLPPSDWGPILICHVRAQKSVCPLSSRCGVTGAGPGNRSFWLDSQLLLPDFFFFKHERGPDGCYATTCQF